MPNETNTDKIRRLELNSATLDERVDNIREDLKQYENSADGLAKQIQSLERTHAISEHRIGELEKKLIDLASRRWDLWKLILAAIRGGVVTLAGGFSNRLINWVLTTVAKSPPSTLLNKGPAK